MNDQHPRYDDLDLTPIDDQLDEEATAKQLEEEEREEIELSIKLSSRRDERHLAMYLLYAVDRSDYTLSLDDALEAFEDGFECSIPRQSFPVELVRNAIEQREVFDAQLVPHLKNWRLERLGCCTKLILHLGLAEMMQTDAIPSIVINEAVELAKEFAEKDAYKFINGILDEMIKKDLAEQESLVQEEEANARAAREEAGIPELESVDQPVRKTRKKAVKTEEIESE